MGRHGERGHHEIAAHAFGDVVVEMQVAVGHVALVPPEQLIAAVAAQRDFDMIAGQARQAVRWQNRGIGHGLVAVPGQERHALHEFIAGHFEFRVPGVEVARHKARKAGFVEIGVVESYGERAHGFG